MTTKKLNTVKKVSPMVTAATPQEQTVPVNGTILALNESVLKAISVYAASVLFSQPQFAAQTNPQNIVGLADLLYKYIQGQYTVTQPSDAVSGANNNAAPTFG